MSSGSYGKEQRPGGQGSVCIAFHSWSPLWAMDATSCIMMKNTCRYLYNGLEFPLFCQEYPW